MTDAWRGIYEQFWANMTGPPPSNATPTQFMAARLSALSQHNVYDRLVDRCDDVQQRVVSFMILSN